MDINYSYFNTAKGYKVVGGTAAQFLKADGSVDSDNYLSQTVANSNFATIQNTGGAAKRTVCINSALYSTTGVHRIYLGVSGLTGYLKVKITSIFAGSNVAGFIELAGGIGVNSGTFHFNGLRCIMSGGNIRYGYYVDPVLKYDSVTGFIYIEIHKKTAPDGFLYVEIESNSAYLLSNPIVLSQSFDPAATPSNLINEVDFQGSISAQSFTKSGGTAAQFLKADGSVDSNAYLPLSGGTMTGAINFNGGEIIFQRSGVNRMTTNSTSTYISGDNGLVVVRPGGNLVTTGQVLFNTNNTSQYTDSHNILLGTQTSVGGSIFHTAVASAVSGYGVWLNYNLQWDGTNFIQPRGSLGSYGFTVNNHKGFSFNYAASGGTNGSATTLTEVASLNGLGTFSTTTVDVKTLQLPYAAKSIIRLGGANNERVHHKVFNDSIVTPPTGILSFSITPPSASATMFDITIKIHTYGGAVVAEIRLTFYRQVAAAINATAGMSGSIWASEGFNTEIVNVGFDPAGKMVINIGDSTIAWGTYLSYEIERMETKYTGGGQDWANGWSASIITDTTGWSLVNIPLQRVATRGWVTPQLTAMDAKYPLRGLLGGNTNSVRSLDTRNVNPLPSTDLQSGVWFDFKTSSVIGLTGAGFYSGVITMVPFSDNSGNINTAFRLAQSAGKIFFQNYTAAATWGPLNEIVHTSNMNSLLWSKYTTGNFTGVNAPTPFSILNNNVAQNIYAGGLLISNQYADNTNIPTNGAYIKGTVSTQSHGDSSLWYNAYTQLSNFYTKNEALNQFVGLNGVQTIADTKTFSSSPVVPNATLNSHAINYGQFNATLAAFVPLSLLGVNNGVATLGANGIVPANQLPSSFERTLLEFSGNFGEKLVQAINAANNGDTINALNTPFDTADSYTITSSININKPINIKFPAGTINFLGSGNIFNINASNVRFYGTGRSSREDLRIITTNITYPNGNGGYHFYARGQNVITVSNMDITGVRTTNYDAQQGSTTKPIDGSGGIYIEKPNPGITGGGNTISNIILENLLIHGTRAHGIYLDTPILGSIKDVRISQGGGHGIFINGGTSMRIENCYVSSTHKTAYALYAHSYSVMNACAAEFSGNGYWLRGCFNVTLLSCGAESNGNRGATVPNTNITTLAGDGTTVVTISDVGSDNVGLFRGTSYVITGGQGINLINCASTNAGRPSASNGTTVSSRDILVRGNTRNVFIGSPRTSVTSGNIFPGRFNISFEGFNGEFPKGQVMYNPATDGSVAPAVAYQYISSINNDANAAPVLIQPGSDVLVMSDTKIHTPITTNQITSAEGLVGNASTASKLQTARAISLTGDATGTINFDGSENISINTALSATGISSGTYKSITVDNKGRVTAGSNPTTLSGFGIADGMSTNHVANGITSAQISNWIDAYLFSNNFAANNPDLTAIEGLSATDGYLRKDGNGQWSLTQATYTLPVASSSVFGGVKLINDTVQTAALDSPSSVAKRTYGVQINPSKQMVVNVPWVNTTYSNGAGINLVGTQFSANFGIAAGTIAQGNDPRIVNAIKLNTQFTNNTGSGLVLSDDYMGGESGIYDETNNMLLVGKENGFHKFGASYGGSGGVIVNPQSRHMGYGGVDPTDSHNHYFNGTIRITQGIYSESSNGNDLYAGSGGFYHLDEEIAQEDKVIRLAPFDKVFSGTNNTFATKNRVVKITLNDGGAIMMDEFFVNQEITIMNVSGDYATFIVNNTSIKVKIDPRSSATFYVNSENKMVMVRMDNDYCRILG